MDIEPKVKDEVDDRKDRERDRDRDADRDRDRERDRGDRRDRDKDRGDRERDRDRRESGTFSSSWRLLSWKIATRAQTRLLSQATRMTRMLMIPTSQDAGRVTTGNPKKDGTGLAAR